MQCPKCNHPLSDDSVSCMYCGEPVHGGAPVSDTSEDLSIEDMVMHTMEPVKDEREGVCEEDNSEADPLSLEKIAAMLAKMKGLLDNGRFDVDVYERVALDCIKDYLTTLNEGAQLIFVSYEIDNSKVAPFLTEDMIEKIKMFVTDTISER
jgi:hypothetical protein